jgi:hypothetical protein
MVFMKGNGNKTILKKLPKIPNKNIPRDAPRIIVVKPMVGLNPKVLLEISDCIEGVAIAPAAPPTTNPTMLKTVLKIPLLKPIQPKTRKAAAIKMSMKFIQFKLIGNRNLF